MAQLIDGFKTPYGMELLATVHWVAKDQPTARTGTKAISVGHFIQDAASIATQPNLRGAMALLGGRPAPFPVLAMARAASVMAASWSNPNPTKVKKNPSPACSWCKTPRTSAT